MDKLTLEQLRHEVHNLRISALNLREYVDSIRPRGESDVDTYRFGEVGGYLWSVGSSLMLADNTMDSLCRWSIPADERHADGCASLVRYGTLADATYPLVCDCKTPAVVWPEEVCDA